MFNTLAFWVGLVMAVSVSLVEADSAASETKLTDPTKPLGYAGSKKRELVLSSILDADSRKVAIINGFKVVQSQVVPGTNAKVAAIGERFVTLDDGVKRWQLRIESYSSTMKIRR